MENLAGKNYHEIEYPSEHLYKLIGKRTLKATYLAHAILLNILSSWSSSHPVTWYLLDPETYASFNRRNIWCKLIIP